MRHVLMGLVGAVGLLVCGCSTTDSVTAAGGTNEGVSQEQSPIFYGTADTTHQAVVALYKQSGNAGELCTGTVIAVNGSKGFVLTAAHCIADGKPDVVLMGNDINSQSIKQYAVSDAKAHPSYSKEGGPYDFAMVTFTGASSSTPVIPAMTKANDNLKSGSAVTFVGYGRTETNDNNSKRNKVSGTLSGVSSIQVQYSQGNGGPCNGDSGGPSLSTIGGTEYVSSVTSYGDQDCTISGVSGRVSAVYDSFIKPYIDGTSSTLTCDECASAAQGSDGACGAQVTACQNDTGCNKFAQCIGNCGQSDTTCQQNCQSSNAAGATKYFAISDCICSTGCSSECATECQGSGGGACGLGFQDTSCNSCNESHCCDSSTDCAGDEVCLACLQGTEKDACGSNAAFNAFYQCISSSCGTECGVTSGQCAYDFSGISADCGTCADGSCCDAQKDCADDATCNKCVTTEGATGCETNAAYKAIVSCLQDSCASQCGGDSTGAGGTGSGTAGSSGGSGKGGTSASAGSSSSGTAGKGGKGGSSSTGGLFGGSSGDDGDAGTSSAGSLGGSSNNNETRSSSSGGCSTAPTPASSSPFAALALGLVAVASRRRRQG